MAIKWKSGPWVLLLCTFHDNENYSCASNHFVIKKQNRTKRTKEKLKTDNALAMQYINIIFQEYNKQLQSELEYEFVYSNAFF